MGVTREILLWASENKWLERQLTRRRFTRRAVRRFMPGEDPAAALAAAAVLNENGIGRTILTLLGENVEDDGEADAVARHYLELLPQIEARGLDSDISVKPTQLGIDIDFDRMADRYVRLLEAAGQRGRLVAIDMESTDYLDRTLELYRRLRAGHSNVVLCLQAYLRRTADDLAALLPLSPIIRLVKGAYKEPPDLAFRKKRDVDANYLKLADALIDAAGKGTGTRVFFGTHDPRIIDETARRVGTAGLSGDAFEFQMLYGIQRELQARLARDGYPIRVLISYGASWFPWYMRRLAERPANVWFLVKNLV